MMKRGTSRQEVYISDAYFVFVVDTALMQGVKKFFNMQKVFYLVPFWCFANACRKRDIRGQI